MDGNYKNESKSNLAEIKQDKIWNDDKYCITRYDNYLKAIKEIAEQLKVGEAI